MHFQHTKVKQTRRHILGKNYNSTDPLFKPITAAKPSPFRTPGISGLLRQNRGPYTAGTSRKLRIDGVGLSIYSHHLAVVDDASGFKPSIVSVYSSSR